VLHAAPTTGRGPALPRRRLDANWIVAIDVTSADDDSPIAVGRANILIHSPTQSFFYSADELPGMSFRFELTRHPKGWWLDRAKRIDASG